MRLVIPNKAWVAWSRAREGRQKPARCVHNGGERVAEGAEGGIDRDHPQEQPRTGQDEPRCKGWKQGQ